MQINSHSVQRLFEREIPLPFISLTVSDPDIVFKETKRKNLYRKEINGKLLDVVMRKNMLVTAYWRTTTNR